MKTKLVRIVIALIILAIFLDGCYFVISYLLLPIADNPEYKGLVIELTQFSQCMDVRCPSYTVQILDNGEGTYKGIKNNPSKDVQTFTVSRVQIDQLILAVKSANYFSLKSEYMEPAGDLVIYTTSVSFQGRTKTVSHSSQCATAPSDFNQNPAPPALCALESKIRKIANPNQWWTPLPP